MAATPTEYADLEREELAEKVRDLEKRVRSLEGLTDALQTQNRLLKTALAGSDDEFGAWDVEQMVPLHDRVEKVSDTVAEHDERFEMFVVEDGKQATPDERAMHLRQVLLNDAQNNDDGIGKMARDTARKVLDGSLHKGTVLDAMRRAANGSEAQIDGASDLESVDGIEFHTGGTVGSDGQAEQSRLKLHESRLTGTEARQILTTVRGDGGGSE